MCAFKLSGALVDIYGEYKYMYYACGVFMLVPGIFFFIMHYYNYKKLDEEQRQSVAVAMRTSEEAAWPQMSKDDEAQHVTHGSTCICYDCKMTMHRFNSGTIEKCFTEIHILLC